MVGFHFGGSKKSKKSKYQPTGEISYLTDTRNGQKYRTVKIDNKTWMAENLNEQTGVSGCYKNNAYNCAKYGRLYDWNTAKTACPSGWHLPSSEEWNDLVDAVRDKPDMREQLLTLGGIRKRNGSFSGIGKYGRYWTATEYGHSSNRAFAGYMGKKNTIRWVYDDEGDYTSSYTYTKNYGFSVRCVADN